MDEAQFPPLPPMYIFFVKTNNNFHQGGHVFFSIEEFHNAKDVLANEVTHLMQSEQSKDSSVEFQSWGITNSVTGAIVEEFTDLPGDKTEETQ